MLLASCATLADTGSIVRTPCLHVGVRIVDLVMLDDDLDGYGLSVRVSTDFPLPCAR